MELWPNHANGILTFGPSHVTVLLVYTRQAGTMSTLLIGHLDMDLLFDILSIPCT